MLLARPFLKLKTALPGPLIKQFREIFSFRKDIREIRMSA